MWIVALKHLNTNSMPTIWRTFDLHDQQPCGPCFGFAITLTNNTCQLDGPTNLPHNYIARDKVTGWSKCFDWSPHNERCPLGCCYCCIASDHNISSTYTGGIALMLVALHFQLCQWHSTYTSGQDLIGSIVSLPVVPALYLYQRHSTYTNGRAPLPVVV